MMIKKWVLKAIVQKTISYLPFSQRINYLFQRYVTKGVQLSDAYFEDRLSHAQSHIAAYERHSNAVGLNNTLEIGTGWYPVVPIALYLYGAETIRTVDVTLLTAARHVRTTLQKFLEYADQGKLGQYVPYRPDRLDRLRVLAGQADGLDFESLTRALHIQYMVQDARRLELPDGSIDLIHSNNTFEHIYPQILVEILREFSRVVRRGGVMSHFIDLSDHFAHFDTSITIYHFLRFSPGAWAWIDNSVQPMNRLRMPDYRRMYREIGIPVQEEILRPGDLDALQTVPVHPLFQGNAAAENAISHGLVISKMP